MYVAPFWYKGKLLLYSLFIEPRGGSWHFYIQFSFPPSLLLLTVTSLTQPPPNIRVRAMFVENLSGPVLQMLGTRWAGLHYIACSLSIASNEYLIERRTYIDVYCRYNIEPFFFSSSLNWIPSRFQEDIQPKKGDRKRAHSLRHYSVFIGQSRYHSYSNISQVTVTGTVQSTTQRISCIISFYWHARITGGRSHSPQSVVT